jgi:hypothetical protein
MVDYVDLCSHTLKAHVNQGTTNTVCSNSHDIHKEQLKSMTSL